MWNEIYVERDLIQHEVTKSLIERFKKEPILIERYDEIWGSFKKPYLHKRDKLNLFIAKKKGKLVKETPDAYGTGTGKHYYFIHAYNCIYECEYCYLQGYFHTPDLVIFLNHDEIIKEMEKYIDDGPVWFHAGEFSDSLALSHLTKEIPYYYDFCEKYKNVKIELRTKSANIKELLKLNPIQNLITSFSLSPKTVSQSIDRKTPSLKARIDAMNILKDHHFPLALHLDPIIYHENFKNDYKELIHELSKNNLLNHIQYISLGVVRFTSDVYREVKVNYPDSLIHHEKMIESFDQKIRYQRPMRQWILSTVKELLLEANVPTEKIYLCMEENQ